MKKICAIGANVMDTLICTSRYPTEDTKFKADKLMKCGGGPAATGLVAAAKLGADCSFIGNFTDDEAGSFLQKDFNKYGVKTDACAILPGYSSFASYIVLSDETKSRTCVFDRGNIPKLALSDEQRKVIAEASVLMVDGNEMEVAIEAAAYARSVGVDVLYDAGGLYEGVEKLLPFANILIPSYEFATGHTKTASAEAAAKKLYELYHPDVVVITAGKIGGYIYDGKEIKTYPSFPIDAVDTNGAGDVFHGAFAFARAQGYDTYKACVFSSAVSAIKCTRLGARGGVPTFIETKNFLKERGYDEL